MKEIGKQKGLTLWGVGMIILIGLFFLFLFFKLFPPYMEDMEIGSILRNFAISSESHNMSPEEAVESVRKRFEIDNIRNAGVKDIKIVPDGDTYAVEINYVVEVEMLGNVSALLDFRHRNKVR